MNQQTKSTKKKPLEIWKVIVEASSVFYWPDGKAETRIIGHDPIDGQKPREVWFEEVAPVAQGNEIEAKGKMVNLVKFLTKRHKALGDPSQLSRVNVLMGLPNVPEIKTLVDKEVTDREVLNAISVDDITHKIKYVVP